MSASRGNTESVCGRSAARRTWSHHSYRGRGTGDGIDDGRSALAAASDFLTGRYLTNVAKTLDVEVRIALRLGIYQLWFLERVPAHAAVHESVELVKRARKRSAAPLVNAVLRKAAKEASQLAQSRGALASLLPKELPLAEQMGILHSHPTGSSSAAAQFRRRANTETARSERWRSCCVVYPAGFAAPRGCPGVTPEGWVRRCSRTPAAGRLDTSWRESGGERSHAERLGRDSR